MRFSFVHAAALCLLGVLFTFAHALPVASEQAILKDDKDTNLYYFHPDRMVLGTDHTTKNQLYGCFENGPMAFVNASFAFEMSDQLKESLAQIKKANPNALFAALSIRKTQFIDKRVTNVNIDCDGSGISFGSTAACTWQLSGVQACGAFRKAAAHPAGVHLLDFNFTYRGIAQGQLKDVTRSIPVVVRLD